MSELGQRLISIVREKAAERPDFVYAQPRNEYGVPTSCLYVRDGSPSCLIGQALWAAGLIDKCFEFDDLNTSPAFVLYEALRLELDQDEMDWLRLVQQWQDLQKPWGEAVALADKQEGLG